MIHRDMGADPLERLVARTREDDLQARLVQDSRDCIKVLDLDGRLLGMNAGGMRVLEICDVGPLVGTSWIEFWQGADREAAATAVATARAGGVGRFVGFFPTTQTRTPMWFDVVVSPIHDPGGRPELLLAVSRDVTEWKQTEALLRAITEGTAAVTGDAFFRCLVEQLGRALRVRYAFVAVCMEGARVQVLAFWSGGRLGEPFAYGLEGTPCAAVVAGETCVHRAGIQSAFPHDAALVDLEAESYVGVPLLAADGRVIGHLVVMDDRPLPAGDLRRAVVESFAARAGAELERSRAVRELEAAHERLARRTDELRVLLDVNEAVSRHLERDVLFGTMASSLQRLVRADRFGIELPIADGRLQGHLLTPSAGAVAATRVKVLPAQGTACQWVLEQRQWLVTGSRDAVRTRFPLTYEVMATEGMESLCAIPLVSRERAQGVLFFMAAPQDAYGDLPRALLEQVGSVVAVALDDCLAHEEVRRLRDQLAAENTYLQEEIRSEHNFTEVVGQGPGVRAVLRAVEQVAPTDATVLVLGETGTGKELIARAIHARSQRARRPLVKVNCAAISAGLVESELFGHVRGAFTGALDHRDGRFKVADGGTIFLDEVGELPLDTQVKLLRVLQEHEFEPVGSNTSIRVDVRVIAATNRDLEQAVRSGQFRSDLFYRLNVVPVRLPPLRERAEDVPALAMFFVEQSARRFGKPVRRVADETLRRLCAYAWPGNVRELQNVIERAVVLSAGPVLSVEDGLLPPTVMRAEGGVPPGPEVGGEAAGGGGSLEEVERAHVIATLERVGWRIEGDRGAARQLGLSPSTLRSRMQRLGIVRPAVAPRA